MIIYERIREELRNGRTARGDRLGLQPRLSTILTRT
jgi:preprotein translocase subunit SecD